MSELSGPGSFSTASQLVRRLQAGDPLAWREMTELYGPLVYFWLRRMGIVGEDAADLFQETFASVAQAIQRFHSHRAAGTFRGWLWTITRHKALDFHRRQRGRERAAGGSEVNLRLAQLPDPFTDHSADATDRSERIGLFHRALAMIEAEFEPRTWEAFWRATVDGQDTATIAEEMQFSPASVRQAKSRVLRRLRQILGDQ